MSDAYADKNYLITAESTLYDRGLDATIACSIISFVLAMLSLVGIVGLDASGNSLQTTFLSLSSATVGGVGIVALAARANVVTIASRRVRGIAFSLTLVTIGLTVTASAVSFSLATLLGIVLLIEALSITTSGVVSRFGFVETEPDTSAGLLAGVMFGVVGLVIGTALGGTLVGFDSVLWPAVAVGCSLAMMTLAVVPREDLGSTLPTAAIVGSLGATIATATIGVGWQWNPGALSGGFTGGAVIPLFVLFGSLLTAWAGAKCRTGFGARGREYGAFLIIGLNAFLLVAVMATIVVFVTVKGVGYAIHGFTIGGLSALVLLAPLLVFAGTFARGGTESGAQKTTARRLLRVVPLAALGSNAALLLSILLTGRSLRHPFTYTVQVNRQPKVLDTAVAVTPETTVGALLLTGVAVLLSVSFLRQYGTLQNVGSQSGRVEVIRRVLPVGVLGVVALTAVFVVAGPTPLGLPLGETIGLAVVTLGAIAAGGLSMLPLVGLLTGRSEAAMGGHAQDRAPLFPVGVFGSLGLLTAVLFLQPTAGVLPSIGSATLVPVVSLIAAVASLTTAVIVMTANRATDDTLHSRLLGEELVLSLGATSGFTALLGLHVAVTGVSVTVFGVSVSTAGTLSWPMAMQGYIPLGSEPGGIMPAVVGTVWLVLGATLFAVPLGIGAAVFLTEYADQGRFTALVEIATNALWSTPSIVFGLFGAAFLIPRLGGDESLLAGMLVLGFMLLPLVLITSREAIKSVPDEYRDASAALGVSRWQTIRSVVLPAAMPGVITGIILGVGRIAGETAPLILVLGSTLNATEAVDVLGGFRFVAGPPFVVNDALLSASASLPTQVWAVIAAGVSGSPSMGWATAFILLMVVLTFYAVGIAARTYFRRKLSYE